MTDNTQPEALRLAAELDETPDFAVDPNMVDDLAAELRRQHARIAELEQAARQALEALSDCVDDSRTVLSQNEQIYTERYRPHVLIEQERVVKDAETAIAALHEALGEVQALSAGPVDAQLLQFYGVSTDAELISAQARHIEKLQAKLSPTPSFAPQRVREG